MNIVEVKNAKPIAPSFPSAGLAKEFADHVQRFVYSKSQLFVSLENTLILHRAEVEHSLTIIGRLLSFFYRRFDPNMITIDGMRLHQCIELACETPPFKIHVGKQYQVNVSELEALIEQAKQESGFEK